MLPEPKASQHYGDRHHSCRLGAFSASSEGSGSGTASYEPDTTDLNDIAVGNALVTWEVRQVVTGNARPAKPTGFDVTPGSMAGDLEFTIKIKKGDKELEFRARCIAEASVENTSAAGPSDPGDQVLEAEFEGYVEGSFMALHSGPAVGSIVISAIKGKVVSAKVSVENGKTCYENPQSLTVATERPNVKGSLDIDHLPTIDHVVGRAALPRDVTLGSSHPCADLFL